MEFTRIACMKCKHYHVTFDPIAPRGCKLFGFKSAVMPYVLVKQSTGHDCASFLEKVKYERDDAAGGRANENEKKDYHDPKYWG